MVSMRGKPKANLNEVVMTLQDGVIKWSHETDIILKLILIKKSISFIQVSPLLERFVQWYKSLKYTKVPS